MAHSTTRILSLGVLITGAWSIGAFAQSSASNRVLVIDEGVDLQHSVLAPHAYLNLAEKNGTAGVDDDGNGYVDDVSGWNSISKDAQYFPEWLRKLFTDNVDSVAKICALYNKVEEGDQNVKNMIRANPNVGKAISAILEFSHGTHVGGIILKYGNPNAEIASLNVFTSSVAPDDKNDDEQAPSFTRARKGVTDSVTSFKQLLRTSFAHPLADDGGLAGGPVERTGPFVSQFDSAAGIEAFLMKMRDKETNEKRELARFVSALKPRVANMSFGAAKMNIRKALDSSWQEELAEAKLPLSTQRTIVQEANYQRLLNGAFEVFHTAWNEFFRANPNTLFVVAAGNDAADKDTPNAGNNGVNEVLPANCSRDNSNVLTVAASSPDGVIADFSNFNPTLVNVAAWGTAVPSLAPNNNQVKMSGTSMASPNAAGVASRLFAANSNLGPAKVRQIMEGTVRKFASLQGRVSSSGMIDPQAALDAARRTLLSDDVAAAIQGAVSSRATNLRMPSILGSGNLRGEDTTVVGQTFKTPDLVKEFIR